MVLIYEPCFLRAVHPVHNRTQPSSLKPNEKAQPAKGWTVNHYASGFALRPRIYLDTGLLATLVATPFV
jgi:hypothetical protein